jgi:hypothetical protein
MENQIGLKELYKQARQALKQGNEDLARDSADFGILRIAEAKEQDNITDDEIIEGITVDLWLTRFWVFLENNNLLLS